MIAEKETAFVFFHQSAPKDHIGDKEIKRAKTKGHLSRPRFRGTALHRLQLSVVNAQLGRSLVAPRLKYKAPFFRLVAPLLPPPLPGPARIMAFWNAQRPLHPFLPEPIPAGIVVKLPSWSLKSDGSEVISEKEIIAEIIFVGSPSCTRFSPPRLRALLPVLLEKKFHNFVFLFAHPQFSGQKPSLQMTQSDFGAMFGRKKGKTGVLSALRRGLQDKGNRWIEFPCSVPFFCEREECK